jgi:SAM-dependent methyltransferase
MLREGDLLMLPVYYLARLSDLAREGIENSGSFRFADHIYRGRPSGRTALGRWIDGKLLSLPATRAFRRRYTKSRNAMRRAAEGFRGSPGPVRILSVPCGLPRDFAEAAASLAAEDAALAARLDFTGMDLDLHVLSEAAAFTRGLPAGRVGYHRGDALTPDDYPPGGYRVAVSTGLGEFLSDGDLRRFYRNVFDRLIPGGTFFTSATAEDPGSDRLLRAFEIHTHYRSAAHLEELLRELPWSRVDIEVDPSGLQAFATAVK